MLRLLAPLSIALLLACAGAGKETTDEAPTLFEDHDADDDGYDYGDDCNDEDPSVHPGAEELCDPGDVDEDCNGVADNADAGLTGGITGYPDRDADGYGDPAEPTPLCEVVSGYSVDPTDCDDLDPDVNPGEEERCDDADVDEDCDGHADNEDDDGATGTRTLYADGDADGYGDEADAKCDARDGWSDAPGDCDDTDPAVHPGADEECDTVDNDCDGSVDESDAVDAATWYADTDHDNYGASTVSRASCSQPSGYVATSGDCDDTDSTSHPGGTEVCDDADNDCDGTIDDSATDASTWYLDADGDSYGVPTTTLVQCDRPAGYAANDDDCNDGSAAISPADPEICDSADTDEDCDGLADDADSGVSGRTTWYRDADADGYGSTTSTSACNQPVGYVTNNTDCADSDATRNPGATEVCDASNVDEDCDGTTDDSDTSTSVASKTGWYGDFDRDGYGSSTVAYTRCEDPGTYYVSTTGDCSDSNAAINPAATEICNATDDDCDSLTDESDPSLVADEWYVDVDGDGYGDPASTPVADCTAPAGYGAGTDCDDGDDQIHPSAVEHCLDGVDDDCDGADQCTITASDARFEALSSSFDFATDVAFVGDVDGDGINDVALSNRAVGLGLGGIYLFSGAETGSLTDADALVSDTSVGTDTYGYAGSVLVPVDDVTGDGEPDLWASAPMESWTSTSYDGAIYLLDGVSLNRLATFYGGYAGSAELGTSMTSLGDWDGDGDEDLLVGSPGYRLTTTSMGAAWIIDADQSNGSAAAISTVDQAVLYDSLYSSIPGDHLCNLGDTDGDGAVDIGVGSPGTISEFVVHTAGATGVTDISSSPRVTRLVPYHCDGGADVNADGYADFTVMGVWSSGTVYTYTAWLFAGPITADTTATTAAYASYEDPAGVYFYDLALADLDGDGSAEWLMADAQYDAGSYTSEGRTLVFPTTISGTLAESDASMQILGDPGDTMGDALAVGDTDGDGLTEILLSGWSSYDGWMFSVADLP